MKKILFILVLVISYGLFGQVENITRTNILSFKGAFTSTQRDAIDVPTGEVYMIYNSTTGVLEYARADDVWGPVGGGAADNLGADVNRILFTVSGGGTVATINSNVVTSAAITDGTIQTEDIGINEITTDLILNGTVNGPDLANDAVASGKIINNTIRAEDMQSTNSPTDGDVQVYDLATGGYVWTDSNLLGGAGISELIDLSDVSGSTQGNRNALLSNGTTFSSRPIVEADIADLAHTTNTDNQTAAQVTIVDAGAFFTATTVEGALQEIGTGGGAPGSDDQTASEVAYSNTTSGLTANVVQTAIDEIEARVDINDAKTGNTDAQDLTLTGNTLAISGDPNTDVDLSGYLDNTDAQSASNVPVIDIGAYFVNSNVEQVLQELGSQGFSDGQVIDTLDLVGTTLRISIERDSVPLNTVDLSSLQDGIGTDDQTAAEVSVADVGTFYTATDVEGVLAEIAPQLGGAESTTVSDTAEIDLTLTGSDITASIIASSIDETKLDVSTNASLDLADTALQSFTEVDGSTTNEIQTIDVSALVGTDLQLSLLNDGEATKVIDLSSLQDGIGTDDQTATEVTFANTTSGLTATDVQAAIDEVEARVDTNDAKVTNTDAQDLTLTVNTLAISGDPNTDVDLSGYLDNTDSQTLSFTSPNLSITGGNSVDISAIQDGTGTDDQTAAEVSVADVGANYTATDVEGVLAEIAPQLGTGESTTVSDTAEIDLTLTGSDITADIVTGSIDETKLDVSTNASLDLADSALQSFTEVDGSVTNEIQTIDVSSLIGTVLNLSLSSDGEANQTVELSSLQDGTGTDDQTAAEVSVADTGLNYTATDVEGVLAEIAPQLGTGESTTVSDTAEIDLTLTGDDITADIVTGSIDVLKLDTGVQTSLGLADTASQGAHTTARTDEQIEDVVGGMVTTTNTETLIDVVYQDGTNDIDFTVNSDLSLYNNATSNFSVGAHTSDTNLTQEEVSDFVGLMVNSAGDGISYDDANNDLDIVGAEITGVDAETLDTFDSTDFGRLASSQTWTNTNTWTGTSVFETNSFRIEAPTGNPNTFLYIRDQNNAQGGFITYAQGLDLWIENATSNDRIGLADTGGAYFYDFSADTTYSLIHEGNEGTGDGLGPDGDKGDITVGGTGTTLNIDANVITDTEIITGAVRTAEILDATILEQDLNITNAAQSGYALTSNGSTGFTWTLLSGDGGDAETLDGLTTSVVGNRWGVIPVVSSGGVLEGGKYLDFHDTDAETADFSVRVETNANKFTVQGSAGADMYIESYKGSQDYARLGANTSGGYLSLSNGVGGTNTTIRGYSTSDFYGGGITLSGTPATTYTTSGTVLRVTNASGWASFGTENTSYAHIKTDRDAFYMDKRLHMGTNEIRSHSTDFNLNRAGSTTARMRITSGVTISDQDMEIDNFLLKNSTDRSGLLALKYNVGASWHGLQIDDDDNLKHWSLMGNATQFGLYDDETNEWILHYLENGSVGLYYNGGKKFETTATGAKVTGDLDATGDVTAYATSDWRLKDNIAPIFNATEKLNELGGYTFEWNDRQDKYFGEDVGVMAQEVRKIIPSAVRKNSITGYLQVDYKKVIPLLIEANKELNVRVKELEAKFEKLEKALRK